MTVAELICRLTSFNMDDEVLIVTEAQEGRPQTVTPDLIGAQFLQTVIIFAQDDAAHRKHARDWFGFDY